MEGRTSEAVLRVGFVQYGHSLAEYLGGPRPGADTKI